MTRDRNRERVRAKGRGNESRKKGRPEVPHDLKPRARPAEGTVVGYAGFVMAEDMLWQEYYMYEERAPEIAALVAQIEASLPKAAAGAAELGAMTTVIQRTPNLAAEKEQLVGALCAMLAHAAGEGRPDAGIFAQALSQVTGEPYLLVKARRLGGGIKSDIRAISRLQVTATAMMVGKGLTEVVSDIIQTDSEVVQIKARLAQAMSNAPPSALKKIGAWMKANPEEARRNPAYAISILEEFDTGMKGNIRH